VAVEIGAMGCSAIRMAARDGVRLSGGTEPRVAGAWAGPVKAVESTAPGKALDVAEILNSDRCWVTELRVRPTS
jgi:hypothetical protein